MGRKDFNKGMEAGARPFEDKFRQTAQKEREWKKIFDERFDEVHETVEAALDEMDSMQKAKFYQNHTIVDIGNLEQNDREILLSLLFTLSETQDEVSDWQQLFLRSVKKYLENAEEDKKPINWSVLKDGDWSIIETIDGIDETKAIAQVVMEFLFLGYRDHAAYMEDYADLFECFNLNKKGFRELREQIDIICRGTGLQGLAEMYGYVPEKPENDQDQAKGMWEDDGLKNDYGCAGNLEKEKIDKALVIEAGNEKIFESKKLVIANQITLKDNARLLFRNCKIIVGGSLYDFYYKIPYEYVVIVAEKGSSVVFDHCTFGRLNFQKDQWTRDTNYFMYALSGTELTVRNCRFESIGSFAEGAASIKMEHSSVNWSAGSSRYFLHGSNLDISDMAFGEEDYETEMSFDSLFWADEFHVEKCSFQNWKKLSFSSMAEKTDITQAEFQNCTISFLDDFLTKQNTEVTLSSCTFEYCKFDIDAKAGHDILLRDSKLSACEGHLPATYLENIDFEKGFLFINTKKKLEMIGCRFSDLSCDSYDDSNDKSFITGGDGSIISNCIFKNMFIGRHNLIEGCSDSRSMHFIIENSFFEDIQTTGEIVNDKYRYSEEGVFKTKWFDGLARMDIRNCKGISV